MERRKSNGTSGMNPMTVRGNANATAGRSSAASSSPSPDHSQSSNKDDSASNSTFEPSALRLTRVVGSTTPNVFVFDADLRNHASNSSSSSSSSSASSSPHTAYVLTMDPLPRAARQKADHQRCIKGMLHLRHSSILPLQRIAADVSLSEVRGAETMQLQPDTARSMRRRGTILLAPSIPTNADHHSISLSSFITAGHPLPAKHMFAVIAQMLDALQYLQRHALVHGCIRPGYLHLEWRDESEQANAGGVTSLAASCCASSFPPLLKVGGLGVHLFMNVSAQQQALAQSRYYPPSLPSSALHDCARMMSADEHAAMRCMLELASMRDAVEGSPASASPTLDDASAMMRVKSRYGAEMKALFAALKGNQTPINQLIERAQTLQRQSSSSEQTTVRSRGHMRGATSSAAASSSAAAAASASASAALPTSSLAALPSPSHPTVLSPTPSPPPAIADEYRTVRCIWQGVRSLPKGKDDELICHVDITAEQASEWFTLVTNIENHYRDDESGGPLLLTDSHFNPLNPTQFISSLAKSTANNRRIRTIILVFESDAPRPLQLRRTYSEEITFTPHHTAITEDPGEYSRAYAEKKSSLPIAWSWAEFIDNALSASRHNPVRGLHRSIRISIIEYTHPSPSLMLVFHDEGEGMSTEDLEYFAQFHASRKARNLLRDGRNDEENPDYLSGQIGEFGVGSKQAAFFNGKAMSVVTAQANRPTTALEFEMSTFSFEDRTARSLNPYEGRVYTRERSNVEQSRLSEDLLKRGAIRDLIEEERELKQFTCIIVSHVKPEHWRRVIKSNRPRQELVDELLRVYQYYLFGVSGLPSDLGVMSGPEQHAFFQRRIQDPAAIRIGMRYYKNDKCEWSSDDIADLIFDPVESSTALELMLMKRGQPFCFQGKLTDPADPAKYTVYSGTIYYYPYDDGRETHPEYEDLQQAITTAGQTFEDERSKSNMTYSNAAKRSRQTSAGNSSAGASATNHATHSSSSSSSSQRGAIARIPAPVFELTWNGRLIPEASVVCLNFIDEALKSSKSLAKCRYRLKGVLHFIQNPFFSPSKNKICINRYDFTQFINNHSTFKLVREREEGGKARKQKQRQTPKSMQQVFADWLKDAHAKLDRELEVDLNEGIDRNGKVHFPSIRFVRDEELVNIMKCDVICFKQGSRQEFGRFLYYACVSRESTGSGDVYFQRLPEEQFGDKVASKPVHHLELAPPQLIEKQYVEARKNIIRILPHSLDVTMEVACNGALIPSPNPDVGNSVDAGRDSTRVFEYPAGVEFRKQTVEMFGHPVDGEVQPICATSKAPFRILRGLFIHAPHKAANMQTGKGKGDDMEHMRIAGYVWGSAIRSNGHAHAHATPNSNSSASASTPSVLSKSYIGRDMVEDAVFDPFIIKKAGTYILEYTVNGQNHVKYHHRFTVVPGPREVMKREGDGPLVLQLSQEWHVNALCVSFYDEYGNRCPIDSQLAAQFEYKLTIAGKGRGALQKRLDLRVRPSVKPPPPAADDSHHHHQRDVLWLDLLTSSNTQLSLLSSLDVNAQLQLRQRSTPSATFHAHAASSKRSSNTSVSVMGDEVELLGEPFVLNLDLSLTAGKPAQLIWKEAIGREHNDEAEEKESIRDKTEANRMNDDDDDNDHHDSSEQVEELHESDMAVIVRNGGFLRSASVQLCDSFGSSVPHDGGDVKMNLSSVWPEWLHSDELKRGCTAKLGKDGSATFGPIRLHIHSSYFRTHNCHSRILPLKASMRVHGALIESQQLLYVKVIASRAPVMLITRPLTGTVAGTLANGNDTEATETTTSRNKRSRGSSSSAPSSSASATAAVKPLSDMADQPLTIRAAVDSELPLSFLLFDEAGRGVTLNMLRRLTMTSVTSPAVAAVNANATATATATTTPRRTRQRSSAEGDEKMDEEDATQAAPDDDDDDVQMIDVDDFHSASSTSGRKRKQKTELRSPPSKRLAAAAASPVPSIPDSCRIEVIGLEGVQRFPISILPADGVLRGIRVPSRASHGQSLPCMLKLHLPSGSELSHSFSVLPFSDAAAKLECRVHAAEVRVDQPIGEALQLLAFDKHGNQTDLPRAQMHVKLTSSGTVDGEKHEETAIIGADAVATSSSPFSTLQFKSLKRVGVHLLTISFPSLPHLTASTHLSFLAGSPTQLCFMSPTDTSPSASLLLRCETHCFFPPIRIVACDANGNISQHVHGDVTLRSGCLSGKVKKLPLIDGVCEVPYRMLTVNYSTPESVTVEASATIEAHYAVKNGRKGKLTLQNKLTMDLQATRRYVQSVKLSLANANAHAHANGDESTVSIPLTLHAGSNPPPLYADAQFECDDDELHEEDVKKFSVQLRNRANRSILTYPTGKILPDHPRRVLFEPSPDQIVRRAESLSAKVTFVESNPLLQSVLPPLSQKCDASLPTPIDVIAAAPARIHMQATEIIPAHDQQQQKNDDSSRTVASPVIFTLLDAYDNVIPIKQLPDAWKQNMKPKLNITPDPSTFSSSSPSSVRIPTLLPIEVLMNDDSVQLASLRIAAGNASLGGYIVSFTFPFTSLPIDPFTFSISDNTDLSRARHQMTGLVSANRTAANQLQTRKQRVQRDIDQLQTELATIHRALSQPIRHYVTGQPIMATGEELESFIRSEHAEKQRKTLAPHAIDRHMSPLTPEERRRLYEDPNYLGRLVDLASALESEDDCALISFWLATKLRGFLVKDTCPAEQLLLSKRGLVMNLSTITLPPRLNQPPAFPEGNPRSVGNLLAHGVQDAEVRGAILRTCGGTLIMDDRASAIKFLQKCTQQKQMSPTILVIKERRFLQGGWDDGARVIPSLAEVRAKFGSFALHPSRSHTQFIQALETRQKQLTQMEALRTDIERLMDQQQQLAHRCKQMEDEVNTLQHEQEKMEHSKSIPTKLIQIATQRLQQQQRAMEEEQAEMELAEQEHGAAALSALGMIHSNASPPASSPLTHSIAPSHHTHANGERLSASNDMPVRVRNSPNRDNRARARTAAQTSPYGRSSKRG